MSSLFEQLIGHWQEYGTVDFETLTDARLQSHWAAQIPASLGYTYVTPEPDWGHVSLSGRFLDEGYVLASQPAGGLQVALCLSALKLLALDADGRTIAGLDLDGATLEEGYAWLDALAADHFGDAHRELIRPDHELPVHSVGEGGAFSLSMPEAFNELAGWYANAEYALRIVTERRSDASAIRCWPHHFDLASLLSLDPDKDSEEARSVGVGFVPGDGYYDEPYYYVTPWPYPDTSGLPFVEGGHWHTDGWVGAVLPGSELLEAGDAYEEASYLVEFLRSAIIGAQQMLL